MSHYYKLLDGFRFDLGNELLSHIKLSLLIHIFILIGNSFEHVDWTLLSTISGKNHFLRITMFQFILKNNPEKIDWTMFALYPDAIPDIKKAMDKMMDKIPHLSKKINWEMVSLSSSILSYDYDKIRAHCLVYKEELMASFYAPKNMRNFEMNHGFDERWVKYE
jgi:hypothetical protein